MRAFLKPLLLLAAMTAVPVGVWLVSGRTVVHAEQGSPVPQTGGPAVQHLKVEFTGTTPPLAELAPPPAVADRRVVTGPGDTTPPSISMPVPTVNIDGLSQQTNATLGAPYGYGSDATGDVGPSHYVQVTSNAMQVFNKNGTAATSAVGLDASVFTNCPGTPIGQPFVNYDPLADAWLIGAVKYYQAGQLWFQYLCLSRSFTGNATTSWSSYAVTLPTGSYAGEPRLGVWHDGYYIAMNQYADPYHSATAGAGVYAMQRDAFWDADGVPDVAYLDLSSDYPGLRYLLPADMDGLIPPASDAPAVFAALSTADQGGFDGLRLFEFNPTFGGGRSDFAEVTQLGTQAIPTTNPGGLDIQQPPPNGIGGSSIYLKSHIGHLVGRLQYRNNGSVESLALNYTRAAVASDVSGTFKAGIGYAQLTRAVGDSQFAIYDDGLHQISTLNRWAPSVATDGGGNLALGYNVSSSAVYPGLRFGGRLAGDEPGQLSVPETAIVAGSGAQRNFTAWSEATSMATDPFDGCTFWMTGPYFTQASQNFDLAGWVTRIAAFKFSQCTAQNAGTLSGTVYNASIGLAAPIDNVRVSLSNGYQTWSIANGSYTRKVPAGTYTVTAVATWGGFKTTTINNVVITAGGTTTLNIGMPTGPSIYVNNSYVIASSMPDNITVDPGEEVWLVVTLGNQGSGATTNLVATLLQGPGIRTSYNLNSQEPYGVINAWNGTKTGQFHFDVDPTLACGETLTLTFLLDDNGTSLGTLQLSLPMQNFNNFTTTYSEGFDFTTPPGLPAGWSVSNSLPNHTVWVTTTTTPDAGSKAAWVDVPATAVSKYLTTDSYLITSGAVFSFRNKYNTEPTADGGILEMSVSDGPWVDVIEAGGTWLEGGYDNLISFSQTSPIFGKMAWSGTSAGGTYQNSSVRLPMSTVGKYVRFRFRMVSDATGGSAGTWFVDTVAVKSVSCDSLAGNMARNFDFLYNSSGWSKYALPDMSAMPYTDNTGVFRFYRTGSQAVVFQQTGIAVASGTELQARLDIGNSMGIRRRVSVLVHDSNFTDLDVCTFWLDPNQPLKTYNMLLHTTKAWTNATISVYAASVGQDSGGYYLLDNVLLRSTFRPSTSQVPTTCTDPNAPASTTAGSELLTNGTFSGGTIAPWTTFGNISSQLSSGVFEFFKLAGTPAGVLLQNTNQPIATRQNLRATFQLGNSSSVRQRVTVLLHDNDFTDLAACTFWLAPGTALGNFGIDTYTTKAWTKATVSVYPATAGTAPTSQWLRFDNAALAAYAGPASGTVCRHP